MYRLTTLGNCKSAIALYLSISGLSGGLSAQSLGTVDGLARADVNSESAANGDFDPETTDFTVEANYSGQTADTFNPVQLGAASRADLFGTNYFEVRGNAGADSLNGPQVHGGSTDASSRVRGYDELFFTQGNGSAATFSFSVSMLCDFGSLPMLQPQALRTSPDASITANVTLRVYDDTLSQIFSDSVNYVHNLTYFESSGDTNVTREGDNQQWIDFVVSPGDRVTLQYTLSGEANSGPYDNQDILISTDPFTYEGYSTGASYFGKLYVGIEDIASSEDIVFNSSMTGIDYAAANVPEPQWTALILALTCIAWAWRRQRRA